MCVHCVASSAVPRPQSFGLGPQGNATQSPCHFIPTQRGFWPPLTIPLPPPLPPLFYLGDVGKHGPSSCGDQPVACLFLLQISVRVLGLPGEGGGGRPPRMHARGLRPAGGGQPPLRAGWLFLFLPSTLALPIRIPESKQ